jgi:hypothetical protein
MTSCGGSALFAGGKLTGNGLACEKEGHQERKNFVGTYNLASALLAMRHPERRKRFDRSLKRRRV